ncbi:transglutaminase domain-containing protein [Romeria aff. gracilis LEGE 07310]|uniref:Transglutaminase domain-containing protein n=1 Tax=Vasconcelosia minhoensis LEGE 07310 TaxID=915328 RepID=A0A8J7ANT6_9CYAN|nr:transglutaminase-like domain-containing protein [Romeria gracilis]MBE9077874.1 transglutaminase domain-containing protein [Romeria aff. gracilis LEGE 07310]
MVAAAPAIFLPETQDVRAFLTASEIVDFEHPAIQTVSKTFHERSQTEVKRAQVIYDWVRDRIPHSFDIEGKIVTCKASEVLQHREGICFAKAHLLAALLRSVGIPAGFCYQRLVFDDAQPGYLTLHGLNAVYLRDLQRWIRLDARGNKPGVQSEFNPPKEQLAYPVRPELRELDYPTIYAQPSASVVRSLQTSPTPSQLAAHLPVELP